MLFAKLARYEVVNCILALSNYTHGPLGMKVGASHLQWIFKHTMFLSCASDGPSPRPGCGCVEQCGGISPAPGVQGAIRSPPTLAPPAIPNPGYNSYVYFFLLTAETTQAMYWYKSALQCTWKTKTWSPSEAAAWYLACATIGQSVNRKQSWSTQTCENICQ